jgi:hypothetical protein
MKLMTAEDYFGQTANQRTGMTAEAEQSRLRDCLTFIKLLNKEFGCDMRVLCVAAHYFALFTRKTPFTEFSMFLGAAMAHFIAAKVEYRHPNMT